VLQPFNQADHHQDEGDDADYHEKITHVAILTVVRLKAS
jgi:hypothetical protein